jgi:hypothetical protein
LKKTGCLILKYLPSVENVCSLAPLLYFARAFCSYYLFFFSYHVGLGLHCLPTLLFHQGETTATAEIPELEGSPDDIAVVDKSAEKKPAETAKLAEDKLNDAAPVETTKPAEASLVEVDKSAEDAPTDAVKPAVNAPTDSVTPAAESIPNGIAEVVEPADGKPDSDPTPGTTFICRCSTNVKLTQ